MVCPVPGMLVLLKYWGRFRYLPPSILASHLSPLLLVIFTDSNVSCGSVLRSRCQAACRWQPRCDFSPITVHFHPSLPVSHTALVSIFLPERSALVGHALAVLPTWFPLNGCCSCCERTIVVLRRILSRFVKEVESSVLFAHPPPHWGNCRPRMLPGRIKSCQPPS